MELLSIAQRRARARRLIEEALCRIEPGASATRPARMPALAFLFTATLALVFVGITSSARALPAGTGVGCYVSGLTLAQGGTIPNISNNQQTYEQQSCEGGTSSAGDVSFGGSVLFSQAASALSEVQLSAGQLEAYASASATSSPQFTSITQNVYAASAIANTTAYWYDELTVTGTPNQDGLVLLRFSIDLDGQVARSAGSASINQGYIRAAFRIDDHANHPDEQIVFVDGPGEGSETIGFQPGTQLQIYGELGAAAVANAGMLGYVCNPHCVPGPYFAEGSIMTHDSARFYIDVVTPGGSYSTGSGQSYESPVEVAEPAAWIVLAGGLLALLAFADPRGAGRRGSAEFIPFGYVC
jgi:hypothetical protein